MSGALQVSGDAGAAPTPELVRPALHGGAALLLVLVRAVRAVGVAVAHPRVVHAVAAAQALELGARATRQLGDVVRGGGVGRGSDGGAVL